VIAIPLTVIRHAAEKTLISRKAAKIAKNFGDVAEHAQPHVESPRGPTSSALKAFVFLCDLGVFARGKNCSQSICHSLRPWRLCERKTDEQAIAATTRLKVEG